MKKYTSAQAYFEDDHERVLVLNQIREVLLSCDLEETIKWFLPTYLHNNKIVIGLGHFKDFVGVWFHHGVFLTDPLNVLINAQQGKTMGLRQWRFKDLAEVDKTALKMYVEEAIKNSQEGLEILAKPKPIIETPSLLKEALDIDHKLKDAFYTFSKAKMNEFKAYILDAKRPETKQRRLEKIIPMILNGEGLNDKYKR